MGQGEVAVDQAEEDEGHAVGGVEACPTAPHGGFGGEDGGGCAHAGLEGGVRPVPQKVRVRCIVPRVRRMLALRSISILAAIVGSFGHGLADRLA